MATNSNRPIIKLESVKPVVGKPSVQPFSKPQVRPDKSKTSSHSLPGLPWDMTAPEAWENKVYNIEEAMGHLSNTERLTIELHYGHFTIEEGDDCWTQADIDTAWARLNALKEERAPTQPSPAFVLNRDFKPEPEYHGEAEEVDEQDLLLPFVYKPDPNNKIDWDAVRAQPHEANVENSAAYKTAVVNLKKRKSEEDLEVDQEAIKKKYEA